MKQKYGKNKRLYRILVLAGIIGIVTLGFPAAAAAEDEIDAPTVSLDQLIPVYYDVATGDESAADLRHPLVSGTTEDDKTYAASADPDAGIRWNPGTGTLTLDHYQGGPVYLANWVKGTKHDALLDVTVKLIGENTITATNVTYTFWANYLDVTFEGDGSLTFQKAVSNNQKRYLRVNGNLTIDGPDINITSTGDTLEILSCDLHSYQDGNLKTVYEAGGNFTLKEGTFFFEKRVSIRATTNIIKASGTINLEGGDLLLTDQKLSTSKPPDSTNGALILTDGEIHITETRVIAYFSEDLQAIPLLGEHYDNLEKTVEAPELPEAADVYELTSLDIADYESAFSFDPVSPVYNGTKQMPEVVIRELKEGVHYTYEYEGDLIHAGTAGVVITGIGSFSGTLTLHYEIQPKDIAELNITIDTPEYIYDGTAKTPAASIEGLTQGTDYEVSYENNIAAGTNAAVILTGKGDYTGTVRTLFAIAEPEKTADASDDGNRTNSDMDSGSNHGNDHVTNNGVNYNDSAAAEGADASRGAEGSAAGSAAGAGGGTTAAGKVPAGPAKGKVIKNKIYKFKITARAKGKTAGTVSLLGFVNASRKKTAKKVTVPASVTIGGFTYKVIAVSASAFRHNQKIKAVVIGKHVRSIGANAFAGCKKLKTIRISSNTLKSVGKNAIKGIHKKAVIKVPKKKLASYKKIFSSKSGFRKTMKLKK